MFYKTPYKIMIMAIAMGFFHGLPVQAEREYQRQTDFKASAIQGGDKHTHGGFLKPTPPRWAYYLISRHHPGPHSGHLEVDHIKPLTGFQEISVRDHFQRHNYRVEKDRILLYWNRNAENPETEWANADLVIAFQPPSDGTYSVQGELFWQTDTPTDVQRGAGLTIGIWNPNSAKFEILYSENFQADSGFESPRLIVETDNVDSLQKVELKTDEQLLFIWHSDRANYRRIHGFDGLLSIIHHEKEPIILTEEEKTKLIAYQHLFSRMDLTRPELAEVQEKVESGDYQSAIEAYIHLIAVRLSELSPLENFSYWLYGHANADRLLDGTLVTVKYGDPQTTYEVEIGPPGEIDFFKAASDGYQTSIRDISSMHWATKYAEAYQKTGDVRYLQAWFQTWEDFAMHWDEQYAAVLANPEYSEVQADGRTRLTGINWLNAQLYLAWRLESMLDGMRAIMSTAYERGDLEYIDTLAFTRVMTRMASEESGRSRTWLVRAEQFVPNQIRHLARELFTLGILFPEFNESDWWRELSRKPFTLTHNPDGSDREHSLNYFNNNLRPIIDLTEELPPEIRQEIELEEWILASDYRDRFLPSLKRPDGILPTVGKNNVWRQYGKTFPLKPVSNGFTSILFPYGGFAVQRENWEPDALYLFMKTSRPSIGHWRAQDAGLQLSAFGRNLLVSAMGEVYDARDSLMGWNGYWYNATGQNTVLVDGLSAVQFGEGDEFTTLSSDIWYANNAIEYMETEVNGPYGGFDFRITGKNYGKKYRAGDDAKPEQVRDTNHKRGVHFLKDLQFWIVTDRLNSEKERNFTQTWCFGPNFSPDDITLSESQKIIYTHSEEGPNLHIHQFGTVAPQYELYYGLLEEDMILGWVGILSDREQRIYTPAPDIHANWSSDGEQILVSVLIPYTEVEEPLSIKRYKGKNVTGFDLELNSGEKVFYRASYKAKPLEIENETVFAESVLIVKNAKGEITHLMILGGDSADKSLPYPNLVKTVAKDGTTTVKALEAPKGFSWTHDSDGQLVPTYNGLQLND